MSSLGSTRPSSAVTQPTLISVPVGNNPARVRLLIYLKGLESEIAMKTPADYGGIASPEYRAMNPQGKIPVLLLPDGSTMFEAAVIAGYIADRWRDSGPSTLLAPTPELRARAALINQVHDIYIASPNSSDPSVTANQGAMYKPVDIIDAPARAGKVAELSKQLRVLEKLVVGPLCCGDFLTQADLALYPTFQFFRRLLPAVFGWEVGVSPTSYPKLTAWLEAMDGLPAAIRVKAEMDAALDGWFESGRFTPIMDQVAANPELRWTF